MEDLVAKYVDEDGEWDVAKWNHVTHELSQKREAGTWSPEEAALWWEMDAAWKEYNSRNARMYREGLLQAFDAMPIDGKLRMIYSILLDMADR